MCALYESRLARNKNCSTFYVAFGVFASFLTNFNFSFFAIKLFIIFALRKLKRKQALLRSNLSAIDFPCYAVTKREMVFTFSFFICYR
jgi:hypothetical protein